jgi:hypothetical protein
MIRSMRDQRLTPPKTFNAPAHMRQTLCIQLAATATSPTIIWKPQHAARLRDQIKLPTEFAPHDRLRLPIWLVRRPFLDIRPSDHSRLSSKSPHHLVLVSADPMTLVSHFNSALRGIQSQCFVGRVRAEPCPQSHTAQPAVDLSEESKHGNSRLIEPPIPISVLSTKWHLRLRR